jgi:hypothetical protein
MGYIGVRGVDGPDSTGVSTDTRAHPHAFFVFFFWFSTPHPDIPQATRCLGILARYRTLACNLISASLGDVVEMMGVGRINEELEAGSAVVCTPAPACTKHVHTMFRLATASKPSNHHTHLHATSLCLKHMRGGCAADTGLNQAGHALGSKEGEQAQQRPASGALYCKGWWWRSQLLDMVSSLSLLLPFECGSDP